MYKNYQPTKNNKTQTSYQNKFVLGNKVEKSNQLPKTKEKVKHFENNRQRFKPNNKAKNNNSNNKTNKNNTRIHSRSKTKSRQNKANPNKIVPSINNEKIGNSHKSYKEIPPNNNKDKKENSNNNIQTNSPKPAFFKSQIQSDLNNPNFFKPCQNIIKIDLKKISDNSSMEEELLKNTTNFENLKSKFFNDTSSLFEEWKKISALYEKFKKSILKKNNFEIDKETLEIKTKNAESCNKLKDQKFWILYTEYLIKNSLLVSENQFLSVMNEAFSYMESSTDCVQLRIYYLEKVKKYSPCFLEDGTFNDKDEVYLQKLKKPAAKFIMNNQEAISSNIKIKNIIKKINKCNDDNNNEVNNLEIFLTRNENNSEGKNGGVEEEFEIIENDEK